MITAYMEFGEMLRGLRDKTHWIKWLSIDTCKAATETLDFLSKSYSNVPSYKRAKIKKRFQKTNQQEADATIHELVIHELLRRLKLNPEWSPVIEGLNPDFMFLVNGRSFIADVLLVKSPIRTIRNCGQVIKSWDMPSIPAESRAKKIADKICEKATKYSKLSFPLVLFIFFGDHFLLDIQKVETALFGKTIEDILRDNKYPIDEIYHASYKNLAAIIACKWFDTNNTLDEGRRLRCNVLHNWAAKSPLSIDAFSSFGQIVWESNGELKRPRYLGDQSMVVKFKAKDELVIKPYSSVAPW